MALVADGSRICDLNRNPLAGINVNFTLANKTDAFIFAGGVDLATGDRYRPGIAPIGENSWFWRVVGGTFAIVAATGEVKWGAGTVLVDQTAVTNANKKTTQTATSISASLREFEGSAGPTQIALELRDENSAEGQIALSVADAPDGAQYEMMMRCVHDAGTTDITFAARFSTPTNNQAPLLLRGQQYMRTQR